VSRLRTEDSGLYECEVITHQGRGSDRCNLTVSGELKSFQTSSDLLRPPQSSSDPLSPPQTSSVLLRPPQTSSDPLRQLNSLLVDLLSVVQSVLLNWTLWSLTVHCLCKNIKIIFKII
uniref:Immunoglobulin V-set domain-containing protein n=1 Tax=Echeneis naucrates TaxID=173247 RepID=A0A665TCL1_ECHNA